jgi:hypothetical protein
MALRVFWRVVDFKAGPHQIESGVHLGISAAPVPLGFSVEDADIDPQSPSLK